MKKVIELAITAQRKVNLIKNLKIVMELEIVELQRKMLWQVHLLIYINQLLLKYLLKFKISINFTKAMTKQLTLISRAFKAKLKKLSNFKFQGIQKKMPKINQLIRK